MSEALLLRRHHSYSTGWEQVGGWNVAPEVVFTDRTRATVGTYACAVAGDIATLTLTAAEVAAVLDAGASLACLQDPSTAQLWDQAAVVEGAH